MTAARRNGRLVGVAVLVVALVLVLLVAWFRHTFHRVEKTLYLPPTGEAAYNPLYALAKTLEADGVKVNARQRLLLDDNALAPTDTLLLFNDPRTLSPPDAERLLDWVEGGGHLLVRTPLYSPGEDVAGPDAPQVPLLDRLSVWLVEESPDCVDFQVEGEEHHVELIRGEIVPKDPCGPMSPINPPHSVALDILNEWSFASLPANLAWVRVQGSLGIPALDSQPEPDLAWLARKDYSKGHPAPADVLLLIEVSDTTLAYDRDVKAPLYARAGIRECWIVDIAGARLLVYRDPRDGVYQSAESLTDDATVAPLAFPELTIAVADILG